MLLHEGDEAAFPQGKRCILRSIRHVKHLHHEASRHRFRKRILRLWGRDHAGYLGTLLARSERAILVGDVLHAAH